MDKKETPTPRARTQLDRGAWIKAAIDVLAEEGITGVRVEVLAKRCGVTKGSFYWHFRDRQDLLDSMLQVWKEGRMADIVKQTRADPGKELDRLYHVIDVYSTSRNRRGIRIELAVRDWARRDINAARVVEEVDAMRLDLAGRLFLGCGCSENEAAARSLMLYSYVFGQSLMVFDRSAPDVAAMKSRIADLVARSQEAAQNAKSAAKTSAQRAA